MVYNETLKLDIPDGWSVCSLNGKLEYKRGITYTSKNIADNSGVAMINLACVDTARNYKDGELKYTSGKLKQSDFVIEGDMLIACTDLTRNADIIGCPVFVPYDNVEYTYSADLSKLTILDRDINKYYLYMTLRTEYYHNYIKHFASGTNVLHLDLNGIDWYYTWLPPIELQIQYAILVEQKQKEISKLMIENRELIRLRDWLLPMLMNGQVEVTE